MKMDDEKIHIARDVFGDLRHSIDAHNNYILKARTLEIFDTKRALELLDEDEDRYGHVNNTDGVRNTTRRKCL
jgi:hypothetical protein